MRESYFYGIVERFLRKRHGCFWTSQRRGTEDVGQIDVVGVQATGGNLANTYEIIAVEVKKTANVFGKKCGQAIGYSTIANRCYLACYDEFSPEHISLAGQLGVGLIELSRRAGRLILGARYNPTNRQKSLKLLRNMGLVQCALCASIVELEDRHGNWSPVYTAARAFEKRAVYSIGRSVDVRRILHYKGAERSRWQDIFLCQECLWHLASIDIEGLKRKRLGPYSRTTRPW